MAVTVAGCYVPPVPANRRSLTLALLTALWLPACGDPDLRRGDDALGLGRYDDAIGAYEAARKRLPAAQSPVERLASAHRALANFQHPL